jgi:hypothetical protein
MCQRSQNQNIRNYILLYFKFIQYHVKWARALKAFTFPKVIADKNWGSSANTSGSLESTISEIRLFIALIESNELVHMLA